MLHHLNARALEDHQQYLHRYAMSQVRDADLADDLVQETFMAAMTSGQHFAEKSAPRTWLVGILRHKITDNFRQHARDPISLDALNAQREDDATSVDETLQDGTSITEGGVERSPEAAIAEKHLWATFERHLEGLPPRTARAFVLAEILGHETDEVARMLNTTPENVWGMVHRARKRLQASMADERRPELN